MPAYGVPNTTTFSFTDVTKVIYADSASGRNLVDAVADADLYKPYYWDLGYKGSKNSLLNFRNFTSPAASITNNDLIWEHDDTAYQTFTVTTNMSQWAFTDSDYEDFSMTVYDSTNSTQITNGIFTDGMVVRVAPNSTNEGSGSRVGYTHIGDGTYMWANCGCNFTQKYGGQGDPPIIVVECQDYTLTLSEIYTSLTTGDDELYVQITPNDITPTPPQTLYLEVYKYGPVSVGSGTITSAYNGVSRNQTITINENAVAGRTYFVYVSTSNA